MVPAVAGDGSEALSVVAPLAVVQSLDPSVVTEVPGHYLAAGSFLLVLLFGALVRFRYGEFVDGSVEASMARPHVSVIYGFIAFGLAVFLGALALSQLAQFGVAKPGVVTVAVAVDGVLVLLLAGLGHGVVGVWLTELFGGRRPWNGLVIAAGVSAVGWLLLPLLGGALAWVAVGAVGVGGPMREWLHSERSLQAERDR